MKTFYITFLLIFLVQINNLNSQNIKIEYIEISDTLLLKYINNFVEDRKREYPKLKDFGYIELTLLYFNKKAINNELIASYRVVDQYYSFNKNTKAFPKFYTYTSNKLVLIFDNNPNIYKDLIFSSRSKRKLIRKVNKYLGKKEHVVAKNSEGEILIKNKNFRKHEEYNLHGGVILNFFRNKTVVVKSSKP